ncbi:polyprenyltransferase [Bacteroidales bacterium 6E]|nr:polyprenyltransferase [Bacteroidales bacterium 6E]
MRYQESLRIALELGKIRISIPVALSAMAGYVLLNGNVGLSGWMIGIGVLFVSCASSAINHIQERDIDSLMPRTMKRPLPSGRISFRNAIYLTLAYFVVGSAILYFFFSPLTVFVSWVTLVSYNLIYTPLKKVTAFAVVPGSLTGALPPFIGWVAAGGALLDMKILLVGLFFFIGQIPHFWLLLLMFGEQYSLAGLPTLNKIFTSLQIKRISFVWILTTLASALLVTGFVLTDTILMFIILVYVFFLMFSLVFRFLLQPEFHPLPAFYRLNILYLLMMFILIAEGLISV